MLLSGSGCGIFQNLSRYSVKSKRALLQYIAIKRDKMFQHIATYRNKCQACQQFCGY